MASIKKKMQQHYIISNDNENNNNRIYSVWQLKAPSQQSSRKFEIISICEPSCCNVPLEEEEKASDALSFHQDAISSRREGRIEEDGNIPVEWVAAASGSTRSISTKINGPNR